MVINAYIHIYIYIAQHFGRYNIFPGIKKQILSILNTKMHMQIHMHSLINIICRNNYIGTGLELRSLCDSEEL